MDITPNYIVDNNNNKIGVILDIKTYQKLIDIVEYKLFVNIMEKQNKQSIEDRIKYSKDVNSEEAKKVDELFSTISSKLKGIDPIKARDDYLREKYHLEDLDF